MNKVSMTTAPLKLLRQHAIRRSLFRAAGITDAFARMGFVQADPIRSPARAQDLILRQRVGAYRAGDLEWEYPSLGLEEDFLYAYGFMTRDIRRLLYPRKMGELSALERRVLEAVRGSSGGETHPRELEASFGRERVVNAWGGYSQATKRALESLHHRGLLRVTRRENGIRVYGLAPPPPPPEQQLTPAARLAKLVAATANVLAPVTEKCLRQALAPLRQSLPQSVNTGSAIAGLVKSGELEKRSADGIDYLLPASDHMIGGEAPRRVRFLAPFDPVVWDRSRFEHFWGWAYRFEAYTPKALRVRGYYAMPLLWGDEVVGWANVNSQKGVLDVEVGFVEKEPADAGFRPALEEEIGSLETFLKPEPPGEEAAAREDSLSQAPGKMLP